MKFRHSLGLLAALAARSPAFAQMKLNDTVTITGWATASYQQWSYSGAGTADSGNLDAALFGAVITPPKTPVTATLSAYYRPSSEGGVNPEGGELTLLDAYIAYAPSGAVTITVGKFLSYLGYESFYFDLDNMVSLANQQFLAPIPGYHEGIKLDYQPDKTDATGVAVVDSLYQKPGYAATEGDGEFKHDAGFEAYYQNTAVTNLTVWAGIGYQTPVKPGVDTSEVADPSGHSSTVLDLWVSYNMDANHDTLAAEEIYKDGGVGNQGSNWLVYFQYNMGVKAYTWFSVSGEDVTDGISYTKYSLAPTYNITPNLAVRAQYSYTSYDRLDSTYNFGWTSPLSNYFGVEMIAKF
ncbi:MAG: outer membrane beta-barrel protein [Opitutaceae bacterium]